MKVIITGGLGFLGQQLCAAILSRKMLPFGSENRLTVVKKIILVDVMAPTNSLSKTISESPIVEIVTADIAGIEGEKIAQTLIDCLDISVFHLAAIMSGEGAVNPDKCLRVNLGGTRNILNAIRRQSSFSSHNSRIRLVYSSTGACYGPAFCVSDASKFLPQNTYGMTKAMSEMMINDYTRRGCVDGRIARLPTVIIRPGKPNAATTSVFSGIVREPLSGQNCISPIDLDLPHPVTSHRTIIKGILALHNAAPEIVTYTLGYDRGVNLPAISVSLRQLIDSMQRVAAKMAIPPTCPIGTVSVNINPTLNTIVSSIAQSVNSSRAEELGCPANPNIDQIIKDYWTDFGLAQLKIANAAKISPSQQIAKKKSVGYIGIGFMGSGMVKNLAKAGFPVILYNRTPEKANVVVDEMKKLDCCITVAPSIQSLCHQCDIVFTCLASEKAAEDVFFGSHGVFESLRPGSLFIDHATVSPSFTHRCHEEAQNRKLQFLDAPISGGPKGAADATLAIMVGGSKKHYDRAFLLLSAMGSNVRLMGNAGSGTATKLVNQLLAGVHTLASCEAMALCKALELKNPTKVLQLLSTAWGNSRILQRSGSIIVAAEKSPKNTLIGFLHSGAPLRLLLKDLTFIKQAAKAANLYLPTMQQTQMAYEQAVKNGLSEADLSVLYCLLEERKLNREKSKL